MDIHILKNKLNRCKFVNGIWIYEGDNPDLKDFGFAPYESFKQEIQDCNTFVQGGLARVLECTPEKEAKNFRIITSPQFYKGGVNVWDFDSFKEQLKIASLSSDLKAVGRLGVDGHYGNDYYRNLKGGCYGGTAFGVLDTSAKGA